VRVFADTSALFAALVRNDVNHREASDALSDLISSDAELITSSYVLLETMALLHARVGLQATLSFDEVVKPLLRVRWVDESLHQRSVHRLALRGGRGVSLVDCSSFVIMEDLDIIQALTYDRHFPEEGFDVWKPPG
jgi:predicted nucleic acid-binding protein